MINRVLIRIKVVQMLYSYLLTRSEFRVMTLPEKATADRRYAQRLYADLLVLLVEMAGRDLDNPTSDKMAKFASRPIFESTMISSLVANPDIRKSLSLRRNIVARFDTLVPELAKQIAATGAYRSYTHRRDRGLSADVEFWSIVIPGVIAKDEKLLEICRNDEGFSLAGFNKAMEMLVETLRDYSDTRQLLSHARNELKASLDKAYELYHMLLLLPVEITRLRRLQLDEKRNKYLPSEEDLNPNLRFVNNTLVVALENNEELKNWEKEHKGSWVNDPQLIKSLLDSILKSEIYAEYMDSEPQNTSDTEFWRKVFKAIILPSDFLAQTLEDKSVYWNDDIDITGDFVLKTLKRIGDSVNDNSTPLLPQFKDDEDEAFGSQLFSAAVANRETYRAYIDRFISEQWDSDRLAFMDIVIMLTAIAEILNFPSIPVAVSMNEYVEIANCYSTDKSGAFVNGILYSIACYLKDEHLLHKEFELKDTNKK